MSSADILRQILAKLEMIETRMTYLHDYVVQREGELKGPCKIPTPYRGPIPIPESCTLKGLENDGSRKG